MRDGRYQGRITLNDGRRIWLEPFGPDVSAEEADALIQEASRLAKEQDYATPAAEGKSAFDGESVDEYFERWLRDRAERGVRDTANEASRYDHHVRSLIGSRLIGSVRRGDLEKVVTSLEDKIRTGKLKWKTANNVWTIMRSLFGDAENARNPDLRVRADDPSAKVHGPDRRLNTIPAKSYLYPYEFAKLVGCVSVPVRYGLCPNVRSGCLHIWSCWRDGGTSLRRHRSSGAHDSHRTSAAQTGGRARRNQRRREVPDPD